jgi:hypothetical protein
MFIFTRQKRVRCAFLRRQLRALANKRRRWTCLRRSDLAPQHIISENRVLYWVRNEVMQQTTILFVIPFNLQSVQVHSANCVKMYKMACRRGLSSALL